MLAMDVDGVLTDGGMYYSEMGDELKKFHTRDGMGIKMLQLAGILLVPQGVERAEQQVARGRGRFTVTPRGLPFCPP